MNAAGVLALMVRTLPRAARGRYTEEWAADLAGARELGLSEWAVVRGAAAVAISIDRTDPAVVGAPRGAIAAWLARWGVALTAMSVILALGVFVTGWMLIPGVAWVLLGAAGIAAAIGLVSFAAALAVVLPLPRSAAWAVAIGTVGLGAVAALIAVVGSFMAALLLSGAIGLLIVPIAAAFARPTSASRRGAVPVAVGGTISLLGIATVGLLHILVWNPLARLPGLTLDEIYAGLAAAGEGPSPVLPVAWASGVVLSAAAAASTVVVPRLRRKFSTRRIVATVLAAVWGAGCSVWVAGFGMGMSIADAFHTSGGDAALTGSGLAALGMLAGLPAAILLLAPGPVNRAEPAPA